MGLEIVSKLADRIRNLEGRLARMEENIPAVYGSQSRGFYGVMGTLDGIIQSGGSQTITLRHYDNNPHSPTRTQTVWLPLAATQLPAETFVFAFNGFVGEKGKFMICGKIC